MSGSKVKAGEAYVEIGIRNRIAQGAKAVQRDLRNIGRDALQIGGAIGGMGLALSAPFVKGAMAFSQFDDAMRSVKGVTQASTVEFEAMTDVAKELGRTTSFTAVEVASLMAELGRAGFKPDQINAMTEAVLNLSRATGTDATLASGIMAATIRQFGLEASEAARVSDVLTAAANGSFNTVEALGEAMTYAGPVAADLGMSLEETAAILGTLGNMGIQGSAAGTALRRLSIIGAAEVGKLEEIFGAGFRNAAGEGLPLIQMLGKMAEATNGLGTGERTAKMAEAFGLLGITAAGALSKTTAETGQLLEVLMKAEGQAKSTAEEMDSGIGGTFRKIMSAIEGADIAIGEAFEAELQTVVETVTEAIGVTTQFMESNKELVISAALVAGGLVAAGAAAITFGVGAYAAAGAIGVASAAAGVAGTIYGGFATLMGIVDAAVLATSAGIVLMGSSSTAAATGGALLNAAYGVSPVVAGLVVTSFGAVSAVLTALTAPVATATAIAGFLSTAWTAAGVAIGGVFSLFTGPLIPALAAGAAVVALLGGAVAMAASQTFDMGEMWTKVKSILSGAVALVREVGGAIKSALSTGDYAAAAQALWLGLKIAFWEGAEGVKDAFVWMLGKSWEFVKNFFKSLVDIAWTSIKAVANAIRHPLSAVQTLTDAIADIAGGGVSIDFSTNADAARAELKKLRATQVANKNVTELAEEAAKTREANKTPQQKQAERQAKDLAKIDLQRRAGAITKEEAAVARKRIQDEPVIGGDTASEEAFAKSAKALRDEIFALENGAEAAERKRLAEEGLTAAEIGQIEVLERRKKALEDAQTAEENARAEREQRMADLQAEGQELTRAMMTPLEKMREEWKNIGFLEQEGVISKETAVRARKKLKEDFEDTLPKAKKEEVAARFEQFSGGASSGPNGSFSAFAAGLIGGGGYEKDSLNYQKIAAQNSVVIAKEAKKKNVARFG